MAVTTTAAPLQQPRAWSIGPYKMEVQNYTAASGDTSVVATANSLDSIVWAMLSGDEQSAQVSISGTTATFTIVDPAAASAGQIILIGT